MNTGITHFLTIQNVSSLLHNRLYALMIEEGLAHSQVLQAWTTVTAVEDALKTIGPYTVIAGHQDAGHSQVYRLLRIGACLVLVIRYENQVSVSLAGPTQTDLLAVSGRFRQAFPIHKPEDKSVELIFWSHSMDGPTSRVRHLEAPEWARVADNYPGATKHDLSRLMSSYKPGQGGLLLLWHGEPGTGKTYALRSMMQTWKPWCRAEYVVDPERFFGSEPAYMIQVLLGGDYNDDPWERGGPDLEALEAEAKLPKWRLLIFEDTGELLAENANHRAGQGLSRLLNVVDGLIGQGLHLQVLITTNEPLDRLHPAVARPGRCAANIKFERFTREEAREWLKQKGADPEQATSPTTLAELFARIEGLEDRGEKPKSLAGFLR